ncbi:MAG: DMT family transporter [Pseudomonadota bacterium]
MTDTPRPWYAALWMIGAILSFTTMAVAGREAGPTFTTFEIMTYRSAIGVTIVLVVAASMRRLSDIRASRLGLHGLRNVAHFTGQNLWFYAVTAIPLAQVFALEFTSPLWVIGLAALFLGERLTPAKIVAGICGFFGVLIVLQPGTAELSTGHLTAALAAIGFAATAIFTKALTRTEAITNILFWLTLMQLGLGLLSCLLFVDGMTWPQGADWAPLILISVAGLAAHYCITTALVLAPASVVMPLDFVRLPAVALIGMIYYDEPLAWGVFAGAALIFGANYFNILDTQRRAAAVQ